MILFPFLVALTVHAIHIVAQQQVYGQCGGSGWTGQITCATGASCIKLNEWYSQCLPSSAPATTTPSTIMTVTTTNSPPSSTGISGRAFRLLPLGDSITLGVSSSGGNGYRSTLHTLLEPGNTVDFIGSVKAGTMADNDNEGHNGASIEQIGSFSREAQALPARPNVILLKAGTVDVVFGIISGGPQRLATLIDSIFDTAPDVTLIVATITPIPSNQAAVNTYNEAVASLVNTRNAAGQHIMLASMASVQSSDLADGLHPNDAGYLKMAYAWFAAIQQADANGWIGQPAA